MTETGPKHGHQHGVTPMVRRFQGAYDEIMTGYKIKCKYFASPWKEHLMPIAGIRIIIDQHRKQ